MVTMVTINGASVDAEDPCALYQALYAVKLKLLAGENISEFSLQSPVTRETVVYNASSMAALDKEMMRLSAACQKIRTGCRPTRRWRFRF